MLKETLDLISHIEHINREFFTQTLLRDTFKIQNNKTRTYLLYSEYQILKQLSMVNKNFSEVYSPGKANISTILRRLEVLNLVHLTDNPDDMRRRFVRLTPQGFTFMERLEDYTKTYFKRIEQTHLALDFPFLQSKLENLSSFIKILVR